MNTLLLLAEALGVAYIMRRIARRLGLPTVTGYVLGGIVLGGSYLFPFEGGKEAASRYLLCGAHLDALAIVTKIALGIVALSIGAELERSKFRAIGRSVFFIVIMESLGAFFAVGALVRLLWPDDSAMALVLGAVASATAPAATVAIIEQYHARGPLTDVILAVVGMDDAAALMIFAFAASAAKSLMGGVELTFFGSVLKPIGEIFVSIATGVFAGVVFAPLMSRERARDGVLLLTGTLILLTSGIAVLLGVSQLLACMTAGAVIVNTSPFVKNRLRDAVVSVAPIFYAFFFVIGGAHLDITLFGKVGWLSAVYFLARTGGKMGGAYLGAWLGRSTGGVRKYVGMGLIPQVGVAVALALVVGQEFGRGQYGEEGATLAVTVMNVLLFTTIITEIVGPIMTRRALRMAGEIQGDNS